MTAAPDLTAAAIKMAAALLVVLAAVWGFYRFARKLTPAARAMGGGNLMRVVENQYIGIKKNILMVQVPGALLVLGVTADRIQMLTRLDDPDLLKTLDPGKQSSVKQTQSFSSQLQRFLGSERGVGRQARSHRGD
jgi:flagellar protein FliO/FliZ